MACNAHLWLSTANEAVCADQASKAVKKAKAESESEDMSGSDGEFDVKPKVQVP